jgi:curved DNA-binding protein CbpA
MTKLSREETYYEILRVSPRATISEITTAYHSAKNAFSKDSLATYSLMPAEESAVVLELLETAYLTLTNLDKRREYDKFLQSDKPQSEVAMHSNSTIVNPVSSGAPSVYPGAETQVSQMTQNDFNDSEFSLIQIRESRGLTVSDVSRVTKIPIRYLNALEKYDSKNLPAKVYVQGFLKNMAQLYRLDPKKAVSSYFEQLEKITGPSKN